MDNPIIEKIKYDTNNISDMMYRKIYKDKHTIYIVYNEPLTSGNDISDFIVRSIDNINIKKDPINSIYNSINNFKVKKINKYDDILKNIYNGFTIIIIDKLNEFLALETKANLSRSISAPNSENSLRGSKDSFVENYQTNIGLIKKRIKSKDLWIDNLNIGKYTDTNIGIVYINGVVKQELLEKVKKKFENINISGIIGSDEIKNLIDDETKSIFPTVLSTERPDLVCSSLLNGKIAIVVDNSPYVLVIPCVLNDYFKTPEDDYLKTYNATFTRVLRYIAFFIALIAPGLYITLITYNQEILPTELLISFAIQRNGVPFPAFFEALTMIKSFEILRESDLRVPGFTGSSLSIVGALILGDAAVSAGIVSPIMIIVVALTAICSLPFTEPEVIDSLRFYRILFMIGGSFLGIIGIIFVFIFFCIRMTSLDSFGVPYLTPYAPINLTGLKNSIIKFPIKNLTKRESYLSDNKIKQRR